MYTCVITHDYLFQSVAMYDARRSDSPLEQLNHTMIVGIIVTSLCWITAFTVLALLQETAAAGCVGSTDAQRRTVLWLCIGIEAVVAVITALAFIYRPPFWLSSIAHVHLVCTTVIVVAVLTSQMVAAVNVQRCLASGLESSGV